MERIDIENARIRVEFLKNETNEVVKSEWFDVVSYFCSSDFEHEMEELLKETGADYYKIVEFEDIPQELQLSDRLPEMFDVEYPNFPKNLRYYIDFGLYERDLMCDYFEIDGHIFR
jgi:hypothetical protein